MVKANHLALAGCKYIGELYEKIDCQTFVERCLKDCGLSKNLAGSNTWYREMTWTGSPEECKKEFGSVPVGAFLFILEQNGKEPTKYLNDGIGNASHMGLKTGMTGKQMLEIAASDGDVYVLNADKKIINNYNKGDGALHSSASRGFVATSTFKDKTIRGGWNRVGLWNKIDYGEAINQRLGSQMGSHADTSETVPETPIGTGVIFAEIGTTVKMRQRPSTGCSLYWNIPIGETVEIYSEADWDRVRWNGRVGYVRSEFVHKGETMATLEPDHQKAGIPMLATVWAESGNTVKMRYRPSLDCNLYEKVPIGAEIAVNKVGEKWSKVSYDTRSEWYMMTQFLKFKEE